LIWLLGVGVMPMASDLGRGPTWPLAVPVAVAAVAVAAPVVGMSERPAELVIGEPFPSGQELLLALILLAAARGILLRRRMAYHIVLALTFGSALDAVGTRDPGRLVLLAASAVAIVSHRGNFTAAPGRLRTAVRAGLLTYALGTAYGLVVLVAAGTSGASAVDAGREIVAGLTASGAGPLRVDGWFETSLGILGGGALLAFVMTALTSAPAPPPGTERERAEAARLVDDDASDTLAPFVLRGDKAYVFSPDRRAVIGYRVLFGTAVAGGDPAGDPGSHAAAVAGFAELCARSGWRMAVLGARADLLSLWRPYGMRAVGIGDEVLLSPAEFGTRGRGMRNVRQAVQRTHNAGVRTEIVREGDLDEGERARLHALSGTAMGGAPERGFSMNLDELLTGRHAAALVVVARAADGTPVGLQRYLPSGAGRRLSLDAMRRAPSGPNGLNERMIADLMARGRGRGVTEVSLNFAAFRELLEATERGALERGGYRLLHLLDRFIKIESLYEFNRKFHPRYVPRSVLFPSWASLPPVLAALLTLEFGHRRPAARTGPEPVDSYAPRPGYPRLTRR
jgi:lysylphosphatidylglycerol synthetase-like protein (DUF2156 family)